jgi:hypothetical protein
MKMRKHQREMKNPNQTERLVQTHQKTEPKKETRSQRRPTKMKVRRPRRKTEIRQPTNIESRDQHLLKRVKILMRQR